VVFDAERAQSRAHTQQESRVIDGDRTEVKGELATDRGVGVEIERPVEDKTQGERTDVSQRDAEPHRPAQEPVKNGQQPQVDAEGEAVDQAEAEKRRRHDPRQTQGKEPHDGPAQGPEPVSGRRRLLGGHAARFPAAGGRRPSGR
jgi:hypothetical protein